MYSIGVFIPKRFQITNIVTFSTWMLDPHMLGFDVCLQIPIERSSVGAELALELVGFIVISRMVTNNSRAC